MEAGGSMEAGSSVKLIYNIPCWVAGLQVFLGVMSVRQPICKVYIHTYMHTLASSRST
jgi:hypothetical protein